MKTCNATCKLRSLRTTIDFPSESYPNTQVIPKNIQDVISKPRIQVSVIPSLVLRKRRVSMSPRFQKKYKDPFSSFKMGRTIGNRLL